MERINVINGQIDAIEENAAKIAISILPYTNKLYNDLNDELHEIACGLEVVI